MHIQKLKLPCLFFQSLQCIYISTGSRLENCFVFLILLNTIKKALIHLKKIEIKSSLMLFLKPNEMATSKPYTILTLFNLKACASFNPKLQQSIARIQMISLKPFGQKMPLPFLYFIPCSINNLFNCHCGLQM